VSATILDTGGSLESALDQTSYIFPAGVFTATAVITHTPWFPGRTLPPIGNLLGIGHSFEVAAVCSSTGEPVQPARPYSITVHYDDVERGAAIETTLAIYRWDDGRWAKEISSAVDTRANTVTATPNRFSLWAVLGETWRAFLPASFKRH
jgi:hypothetical protein